jgi:dolichol-phosphate mannosyltransferase
MAEPAANLDVSVVVPTYNEAENVPVLVPKICEVLEKAGIRGEVVIVDDGSPDGTGRIAQGLSDIYPVRVQVRSGERGLATAVVSGFGMSTAEVCVVMDSDGSHPVEKLPEMIRPILDDRADITVGSRNIAGGGAEKWPWHRRLVSKTAGLMAAGLCKLSDPTSGFMGVRRRLLEDLKFNPIGYKIVLETVVKAAPARVLEVPIVFSDRQLGKSKLGLSQQVQYIRHLCRLHQHRRPTFFEFL